MLCVVVSKNHMLLHEVAKSKPHFICHSLVQALWDDLMQHPTSLIVDTDVYNVRQNLLAQDWLYLSAQPHNIALSAELKHIPS